MFASSMCYTLQTSYYIQYFKQTLRFAFLTFGLSWKDILSF